MYWAPQEIRTYFTTFSTAGRLPGFQVERNARLLIDTIDGDRQQARFSVHAFVVMPDHVHTLITPAHEIPLEKAIQLMKGGFSFRLRSHLEVWERGHFDKRVSNRAAYEACVSYIHQNPVVARLVQAPDDYAFSSSKIMQKMDPMPGWFR